MLERLKTLVKAAKEVRAGINVTVCSIPNRIDQGTYIFSRSESVNSQLGNLTKAWGASFLDLSYIDRKVGGFLSRDGVHYNIGAQNVVATRLAQEIGQNR